MTQYEWFIVVLPASFGIVLFLNAIVMASVGDLTKNA